MKNKKEKEKDLPFRVDRGGKKKKKKEKKGRKKRSRKETKKIAVGAPRSKDASHLFAAALRNKFAPA